MSVKKLYMASVYHYNKYRDNPNDLKVEYLTWDLSKAIAYAKRVTASYDREGEVVECDETSYSSNFMFGGGAGILIVSADVVRCADNIRRCKVAVLKEFAIENNPSGAAIPTTKKLLVPHILSQLVIGEYDSYNMRMTKRTRNRTECRMRTKFQSVRPQKPKMMGAPPRRES